MDLAQLFKERRFRYLVNIIDGLPRASHIGQARADDEQAASPGRPSGIWRPSVRHYDENAVILSAIQAGIENLIAIQADKYKPSFIPPPLTAADRIRARIARQKYLDLSRVLFPQN